MKRKNNKGDLYKTILQGRKAIFLWPYITKCFVSLLKLDRSGVTTLEQRVQIIRDLPGDYWFPEKSRLQVQADVIEQATGNKESALDKSCQFTSSPYLVEFKNTMKYFKPGLRFVVKVW